MMVRSYGNNISNKATGKYVVLRFAEGAGRLK